MTVKEYNKEFLPKIVAAQYVAHNLELAIDHAEISDEAKAEVRKHLRIHACWTEETMNKTKYNVRHVACNMEDFCADRHRFRFEYNGKEYVVPCYGAANVTLDEISDEIPEDVLLEVQEIIFRKIDKEEKNWRYPEEAYEIADEYAREYFR